MSASCPTPRNALRAFLATLLVGMVVLAGFNFAVNPFGYYATKLVRPLTWSSRQAKTDLMRKAPAPEVLILGSSRSMNLQPDVVREVTGKTAFNASVDSAQAEDYLALLQFALQGCHWHPRLILLGIDVEAFHNHNNPDMRLLTNEALRGYLPLSMRIDGYTEAARSLFAWKQLHESVRALGLTFAGFPPDPIRFLPDGKLEYLKVDRSIADGTFKLDLEGSVVEYQARFLGFTDLDPARLQVFTDLIRIAVENGAEVRAFVTPLHANLREYLIANRGFAHVHDELVAFLQRLQTEQRGFSSSDFTDVTRFGGAPDLFYDGAHIREENAKRLLITLLQGTHALQ